MSSLTNENILSTMISTFGMKEATHLVKQVNSVTFNKLLLRYINYENIFKSLKIVQVIMQKGTNNKNSIALLHNGNMVSFDDYEIKIFNTTNFECVKILKDEQPIKSGIILPNGNILTCNINRLKIWKVNNDFKCSIIKYEKSQEITNLNNLFLLSNSNIACYVRNNGIPCIAIFDKNFKLINVFEMITPTWRVDFANINNNRFVFASFQFLEVCNLEDYKCFRIQAEGDHVCALLFIKKNNFLLSSSLNHNYFKVWDTNNFHCIKIIQTAKPVFVFLLLPCRFVVCGLTNCFFDIGLEIWNIDKGECINSLKGYKGTVKSLIYKDKIIILKNVDGEILKWNY
jgi:WD40 repeat protein